MSDIGKSETAKREEAILAFWKEQKIFEKSLAKKSPKGDFIFYDGPPFATGLPHTGSLLSSIIKDVVPRYKTMQGYHVPRRWGWDCHGLPIESAVEKKLNLKTKKDILNVGIDVFNETARSMVLEYVDDWEKYVDRVGRFVDFKNSYKTMDNSYIESVWWALKRLNEKKLLYEGRKVLMYCTHCETPLAKAEIAMDNTYKDITEEALTVKFKLKNPQKFGLPENTFVLAWTTTPWTLPGNVGLAVGPDISYVLVEHGGEYLVVAKDRLASLDSKLPSPHVAGEFLGTQLIGAEYEPLYDIAALDKHKGKKHMVLGASFVTTTDGTGIVHTAVMYGEDDFALGQKEGLPMVQLLNANGTYNDLAPEFVRGEYIKKAEKIIKDDLETRGLLFAREPHTHSYPHCYRCGTPLIYNAVGSWFINIQKVKQKLLSENEKITWVPEHLKHGRFKHNLENAPDWTISRNRFWASPIPVWKEKGGKKLMVLGSVDELLKKTKRSGNRYFAMRHGLAQNNIDGVIDSGGKTPRGLVEEGKRQVAEAAKGLFKHKIDLIIVSPLLRTRETAAIVQKVLGLPDSSVMVDERIQEVQTGVADGTSLQAYRDSFSSFAERFTKAPEGAETYTDVRRRMGDFLFDVERRYTGKNILIVTHGRPMWCMKTVAEHRQISDVVLDDVEEPIPNAGVLELPFVSYPHNKDYDLDLHRPYIDAITLVDEQGSLYERVPEVLDCWVESGAMPFASAGYPRNKKIVNPERFFGMFPKGYPGDFIAEYIAQTRTWFYYMHAIGVLLFGKLAFRAVVSTGTILASDGSKMSKSKGNYTDPLNLMHLFGADALRFHLLASVVMQSEDLSFRDDDVREAHNRVVQMLWNCFKFYELYKHEYNGTTRAVDSTHVLDQWMLSRVGQTIHDMTVAFDAYDTPGACRTLRACIDDYSTWYVRRSRDRVKGTEESDKQSALATQREVLLTLAALAAPIMPFMSESIYQNVGGSLQSVHLESWPTPLVVNTALIADMEAVRTIASKGLEAREKAGIKVKQPLSKLSVKALPTDARLHAVIADEVNVKTVVENKTLEGDVLLDTEITLELEEEGTVRTLVRRIQEWRKEQNLTITDRPAYMLIIGVHERATAEKYHDEIKRQAGISELTFSL